MQCDFCGTELEEIIKDKQANCPACLAEHKYERGEYVPVWRNHHTVCQVIRDIHSVGDDFVKYKCTLAIKMTKRLHDKYKVLRDDNESIRGELLELKMKLNHLWGE